MKIKIQYSEMSLADISEICSIIAQVNRQAASRTRKGIRDLVRHLYDHPQMGAPLDSICMIPTDFKFLVYDQYLIFYTYHEQENLVRVARVLNGTNNYLSVLLRGNPQAPKM